MKQGKSIEELGLELKRQRLARKDIITSTNNLSFTQPQKEYRICAPESRIKRGRDTWSVN